MINLRVVLALALVLSPGIFISPADSTCLLRGQVFGPAGLPEAGAHILAAGWAGTGEAQNLVIQETESEDQGIFTIPCPGEKMVVVRAETRRSGSCSVFQPPADRNITLRIQPGTTLRGSLLDLADHGPLQGGQIDLLEIPSLGEIPEQLRALFRRTTLTGPGGRFEFQEVPEGLYHLEARVHGYVSKKQGPIPVGGPSGGPVWQVLMMEPGKPLQGRVFDQAGNPLEGTEILIESSDDEHWRLQTDSQGRFELEDTFLGPSTIQVKRTGFLTAETHWYPHRTDEREEGLVFQLQPASPVRLRLRDDGGEPIQSPVVWSYQCEGKGCCGETDIDWCLPFFHWGDRPAGDGTLVLNDLPPERGALVLQIPGFLESAIAVPENRGETVRDLGTVVVSRGSAIQGVLKDDQGRTISEAEVNVNCSYYVGEPPSQSIRFRRTTTTPFPDGRFFVGGFQDEMNCQVGASATGFVPCWKNQVRGGAPPVELILVRTGKVSATLRDEMTDRPLAVFEIEGKGAFHNPEGTVVLEELQPGWHTFSFRAPGHVSRSVDVEIQPGETTEMGVLRLKRGVRVEGRVVDLVTGAGVVGAGIGVVWGPGEFGSLEIESGDTHSVLTITGAEGEFTLDGMVPGMYRISAEAEGYVDFEDSYRIQPGQNRVLWEMAMDGGGVLSVKMEDQNGRPMPRCQIWVEGGSTGFEATGETDEQGHFDLSALPPGVFSIRSVRGCPGVNEDMSLAWFWKGEVRRGENTQVVLRPQPRPVIVKGRVSRGDEGFPVHMVWMPAGESGGGSIPEIGFSSDENGAYEGRLLAGGPYDVFFSWPPRRPERVEVPETAGLEQDFEYPLPGSLQGRIVDTRKGGDLSRIRVKAQSLFGQDVPWGRFRSYWDNPDDEGRFSFGNLTPGTYGLRVASDAGPSFFVGPFEVESGRSQDVGEIQVGDQPVCQLRIEDEAENSVAGAGLFQVFDGTAWVQEARSTKSGLIRWTPASGGNPDLVVLREGYVPTWVPTPDCQGGLITVRLETGEPVTLEVRDQQEAPVPALTARVKDEADRPLARPLASRMEDSSQILLMTDEKGQLRLDSLAPGSYSAEFMQGGRVVASGRFMVRPGRKATPIFRIR